MKNENKPSVEEAKAIVDQELKVRREACATELNQVIEEVIKKHGFNRLTYAVTMDLK